jgi:hypothetical protein
LRVARRSLFLAWQTQPQRFASRQTPGLTDCVWVGGLARDLYRSIAAEKLNLPRAR